MNNHNLFDSEGNQDYHKLWRSIAESEEDDKRELLNQLYSKFHPYSDSDFKSKLKKDFFPAFWEMDLAYTLLDSGFKLSEKDSGNRGPDLCLINTDTDRNRIWIEATCPQRGDSSDKVSLGENGQAMCIDSEKIMLRLTSAIKDKYDKHKNYLDSGICQEDEPFIIAINGSLLTRGPGLDDYTPRIVKAVFNGGSDIFIFDKATGSVERRIIDHRSHIKKHNNRLIDTNFFLINDYKNISALLFSESSLFSRPCETGSDYIIVHNPSAENPLAEGYFQFGSEYMLKQSESKSEFLNINSYRKLEYLYD